MYYYIYVLQSKKDKSLYIGYTTDIKQKLEEHNKGYNKSTKLNRPYRLIFYEAFIDKKDAENREVFLKSGWGWRSIKKLLNNYLK